jgi:hypothetical protein
MSKVILADIDQESQKVNTISVLKSIKGDTKGVPIPGATDAGISKIEADLCFEIPPALKAILRFSDGVPNCGIDSCSAILGRY